MKIYVPMEVSRWQVRGFFVEVWGWVGDYEVMLTLPFSSSQAKLLLEARQNVKVVKVNEKESR